MSHYRRVCVPGRPFGIDAIVILPDHLHCIWRLPPDEVDYSTRWKRIKQEFSRTIPAESNHRAEKRLWQRRFWEHVIRDEKDWENHMIYIYYNPVKHGYAKKPLDWQYSSFAHREQVSYPNVGMGYRNASMRWRGGMSVE
uniref:Putative transposase n=1 Tax=Candidatus Kentrum sp. TC TaxID=2126339 RepID=A0A450Y8X3_9GAMM|nr:MAG: putative transposase [Candidatus Kentron sp. TC]VFK39045.1 MAG: putative transposase [Candidatus Kentron sp. TC]